MLTSFTKLASQSVEIGAHFRCIRASHACTIEKPNFAKGLSPLAVTHYQTIVLNAQLRTGFDGDLCNTSKYISPHSTGYFFYPLPQKKGIYFFNTFYERVMNSFVRKCNCQKKKENALFEKLKCNGVALT